MEWDPHWGVEWSMAGCLTIDLSIRAKTFVWRILAQGLFSTFGALKMEKSDGFFALCSGVAETVPTFSFTIGMQKSVGTKPRNGWMDSFVIWHGLSLVGLLLSTRGKYHWTRSTSSWYTRSYGVYGLHVTTRPLIQPRHGVLMSH